MKTIEITIAPDGASRMETKGFSGTECQLASRFLEQSLGSKHHEILKSELFSAEAEAALKSHES